MLSCPFDALDQVVLLLRVLVTFNALAVALLVSGVALRLRRK